MLVDLVGRVSMGPSMMDLAWVLGGLLCHMHGMLYRAAYCKVGVQPIHECSRQDPCLSQSLCCSHEYITLYRSHSYGTFIWYSLLVTCEGQDVWSQQTCACACCADWCGLPSPHPQLE